MVSGRQVVFVLVLLGVIGAAYWAYSLSLNPRFQEVVTESPCSRITFSVFNPGTQITGIMQATASVFPVSEDFLFLPSEPVNIESLGPSGSSTTKIIEFRTEGVPVGDYQITLTLIRISQDGNTITLGTSQNNACTVG